MKNLKNGEKKFLPKSYIEPEEFMSKFTKDEGYIIKKMFEKCLKSAYIIMFECQVRKCEDRLKPVKKKKIITSISINPSTKKS